MSDRPALSVVLADPALPSAGTVFVFAAGGGVLSDSAAALDQTTGGALVRAMGVERMTGKKDETVAVLAPAGTGLDRVVVIGVGDPVKLDQAAAETLGGLIAAIMATAGIAEACVMADALDGMAIDPAVFAAALGGGATARVYRLDTYRTKKKDEAERKPDPATLTIATGSAAAAAPLLDRHRAVVAGVHFARDLVTEPPNVLYPESYAERIVQACEDLPVDVHVMDAAEMKTLGMGSLLGVAQGSYREPRMVVMRYQGADDKDAAPVALVGKGITFDTGGISLKPAAGMEEMKTDMAGSAAVVGAMLALAGRKAKANVVGVVALAENMPSGIAQRPSDIVTSMSGQTIEVLNTDAEGRLILADALWYTQDRYKPVAMVNLATLTGAVLIALGNEFAGVMGNDEGVVDALIAAGAATGDRLWQLPLDPVFDKMIDSDIADVKNIAGERVAGSTIGGQFLQRFVNQVPWAHLDIAGTAWSKKDKPLSPKGATGFGVRLLDRWIADRYEP